MRVNFIEVIDGPDVVVAVNVVGQVFVVLGVDCEADEFTHSALEAADDGPVAVEDVDCVVGRAKLCGRRSDW